jgi:4'-phosphopantetheinyl transferase
MKPTGIWQSPPQRLTLANHEVHVWQASLAVSPACLELLVRLLSKAEKDRAERFHFEKDRRRFIAARGTLRLILSRYLEKAPETITFDYNRFGKPTLPPHLASNLRFNLSHANELALYALTTAHEVGVDIEYINHNRNTREIIERFFSENEKMEFEHLPESMRLKAFFSGWTRKEAFIKARGQGLSFPLKKFTVSLDPDQAARLIHVDPDKADGHEWMVKDIPVNEAYRAALAVSSPALHFNLWKYSGSST